MAMASNGATPEPFRFLDLPKDIRLMVYERLPRSTNHLNVGHRNSEERITLISHSVSTAILRACHQVYQEALPLVNKAIREWIQDGGVKVIGTMEFVDLCGLQKLLYALCYISNINFPKSQSMHLAKSLNDDAKPYVRTRIHQIGYSSDHDVDNVCAWVARSALILGRQRIAMGIMAAASALPSINILLSPEHRSPLPSTQDEQLALRFERLNRVQLERFGVSMNIVGFINAAYLEMDSISPCTCDWRPNRSDIHPLTTEEWYRTWK